MPIDRSRRSPLPQPEDLKRLPRASGVRSRTETRRRSPAEGRATARIIASPAMDFILAVARYRYVEAREGKSARARKSIV